MSLTKRQQQVVSLLAQGNTAEQCGEAMHRSVATVRRHVILACERVGARNAAHLVALALSKGWIPPLPVLLTALVLALAAGGGDDQMRNTARIRVQRPQTQLRREV
ncbi:helix-turn-helix transcriptional regulator [Halomonas daqingensis]|uniref:Helix-turn-helix transcriptional regulator n=1 Tax=Billgrantia desiderata TaxID=52021 RepID=A0ABS9B4J4_9GAMM|nr:helix-turn-helix transcriptional regulator [Halomonas desiderata]MCE8042475.1 helix-turn-helix transcriptional regulator [Halomonas desiderata]MCE8047050.1 helix-turn-helix transcriptional regulator [Halomonas desiderata]